MSFILDINIPKCRSKERNNLAIIRLKRLNITFEFCSTFGQTPYVAHHRGGVGGLGASHLPSAPPSTGARLANTLRRYHHESTPSRDVSSRNVTSQSQSRDVTMRSERTHAGHSGGAVAMRQNPQGDNSKYITFRLYNSKVPDFK